MLKIEMAVRSCVRRVVAVLILVLSSAAIMWPSVVRAGDVTYQYDSQGRLKKATFGDGTIVDYSYDSAGNRTSAAVTPGVDSNAPTVPGSLSAAAISASRVDLSWTASTDDVEVTEYAVQRCAGSACTSFAQTGTSTTASYSDSTGLIANTAYRYRVVARDAAGNTSGFSNIASAFTPDTSAPSAPGGPTFSNIAMLSATAQWTAATDDVAVTAYEYRLNGGAWQGVGGALSVDLTGLSAGTAYTFEVRARDAASNAGPAGSGTFATTDTAAPTAPGVPSFSNLTGSSVVASWSAASDNVAVTEYEYQHNTGTWVLIGNVLTLELVGLESGFTQTFRVRARDAAGNVGPASSNTFTAPDTAAPSVPSGVTLTSANSNVVTLSWSQSSDNVGVAGYSIKRGGSLLTTVTTTSYTDNGVSGSTTYSYTIAAYDAAGNTSGASTAVSITTPDSIAPTTPGGLTATAASPSQVDLSWSAATDVGGSGLAGYRLYRGGQLVTTTTATSFIDTNLSEGTAYSYTVTAYDNAGNESAMSAAAVVTTPAPLSASISATDWDYLAQQGQPTYTSPNIVVTPRGGSGGYTYSWQRVSGDTQTTVNSPTSNTTRWSRTVPSFFIDYKSYWRCEVKDSSGTIVYTTSVEVNFRKENLN